MDTSSYLVLILDDIQTKFLCFFTFGKISLKFVISLVLRILNFAGLSAVDTYFHLVFGDKLYFYLFSGDRMSVALRHSIHVLYHDHRQGNGPFELVHYTSRVTRPAQLLPCSLFKKLNIASSLLPACLAATSLWRGL